MSPPFQTKNDYQQQLGLFDYIRFVFYLYMYIHMIICVFIMRLVSVWWFDHLENLGPFGSKSKQYMTLTVKSIDLGALLSC